MRSSLGTAVFSGMLGVTLFGIFLTPVFYYVAGVAPPPPEAAHRQAHRGLVHSPTGALTAHSRRDDLKAPHEANHAPWSTIGTPVAMRYAARKGPGDAIRFPTQVTEIPADSADEFADLPSANPPADFGVKQQCTLALAPALSGLLYNATDLCLCLVWSSPSPQAAAQRQMERLDRGVVAVNQGGGRVFVSWRMLGTDAEDVAFDVYRQVGDGAAEKLNAAPIDKVTWFVDEAAPLEDRRRPTRCAWRRWRERRRGRAQLDRSTLRANAPARPTCGFPSRRPSAIGPTTPRSATSTATASTRSWCTGRPRPRQLARRRRRPSRSCEAYKLDGTLLWRINLGQEHPRGRPLHAVHGLRPRRRRPGRGGVQDGRRHDRRHGQGRSATPKADHRNRERLHPRRARSFSPSSTASPARRWPRPTTSRRAATSPTGATTTATASTGSSPASPTSTASGRAS